nr:protein kinase-like domain, phloem protein 2-like protein [Tanacetum cinerariifolium]
IVSLPSNEFAHLKIPLENILSATNNFAQENVLGENEIEKRNKGQLLWSGELIDIHARRFKKERNDREQLFWTEISMLSTLKHKNVVSLVGFCDENDEKIIIIMNEMARGPLQTYLSDSTRLTWVRRLEICVGVAHALSYIHYDEKRDFSVIHRYIDSSRFGLNNEWELKLYDFEMSMKIKVSQRHHSFHTNLVKYVNGYGDPTYIETKSVNHKSDMYSFGIVMFELLCDNIVPRLEKALELARENRPIHSAPNHLAHLRIPLEDIESATNYFDEENVIDEGGFGKRHKGQLLWSGGELIDITAWRLINEEWDDEIEQQLWTEISMLYSLKHNNIVSIVGFYNEVGAATIIYKHSMGRLVNYLSEATLLTWVDRLEICIGLAHALSYIHYDETRDFSVIHQNISSYTIRLNNDREPKLSEFQHSMKIKASERHNSFHIDSAWSRKGYTGPTCLETNIGNHKSDIYSFGIVLFELLCEKTLDGIIDPDLWKQMETRSLNILAETAYGCVNEERSQHPNIDEIVTRLEKALELQLECVNVVHLVAAAEVEGISSNHEKGLVTNVSSGSESHITKKTKSFLKDVSHLKLSFQELQSAANNFDTENKLDENGWICKGRLLRSGQFIDIVVKGYQSDSEKDDSKMFRVELLMLSSLKHKNLVSLIGFMDEAWVGEGYNIQEGGQRKPRKISRSSKILLDDKWEPKLSGFELSLKNTVARRLLLCGKSANNEKDEDEDELREGLLSQLDKSHLDEMIMSQLRKQMDPESFIIFSETANWCIKEDRADRPYIDQVVKRLEKALELQWKHENPIQLK